VRVYGPSGTRAFPTDRNPLVIQLAFAAGLAPGGIGDTTALAYTVPTGRRALITLAGTCHLDAGPIAAGEIAQLWVSPSVGATLAPRLQIGGTATSVSPDDIVLPGIQMPAGQTAQIHYLKAAGTASMTVSGLINGVEYDA